MTKARGENRDQEVLTAPNEMKTTAIRQSTMEKRKCRGGEGSASEPLPVHQQSFEIKQGEDGRDRFGCFYGALGHSPVHKGTRSLRLTSVEAISLRSVRYFISVLMSDLILSDPIFTVSLTALRGSSTCT